MLETMVLKFITLTVQNSNTKLKAVEMFKI